MLLNSILNFLKNKPKDELIGKWLNGADNGSGLNSIWGYGLEFKDSGIGINYNWGSDIPKNEEETTFNWERIGNNTIKIRYTSEDKWSEIKYEISDYIGAYKSKYYKIVKVGDENFWDSPEPLYKVK